MNACPDLLAALHLRMSETWNSRRRDVKARDSKSCAT